MKTEKTKMLIRWYILGAIGAVLMAAGDWLLGCIPLQETDTGLFNRAYYLSGSYGLWRPVLTVGLGAIGGFLYYFVVKALNADIDAKYRKTKSVQYLCGIFTVADYKINAFPLFERGKIVAKKFTTDTAYNITYT